jgi:uncharacterized 2Fe-2S/4Fe-4S cluster protein (DUF4445 family)
MGSLLNFKETRIHNSDKILKKAQVVFEPDGKKIVVAKGTSILEAAQKSGIKIRSECGGEGVCAKCVIIVSNLNSVSPPTRFEEEKIGTSDTLKGRRLACLTKILSDLKVQIPKESRTGKRRVQVEGLARNVELNPSIVKMPIKVELATLKDLRSDLERVLDAVKKQGIVIKQYDTQVLRDLSNTLRNSPNEVLAVIRREEELIEVEASNSSLSTLGFAIDIGTSKIVATLVDLMTGRSMASGFIENPQMIFGEDVISRISYAMENPTQLKELQSALLDGTKEAMEMALKEAGVSTEEVYELVVVGNTAMHHLFLGINPKWLALAPYVPTVKSNLEIKAQDLGLVMRETAMIYMPPIIAGFVGSDAVADILTLRLHESDSTSLALDIGTNTEVFLVRNKQVLACSCASGPAFEGVHITDGMKAVSGAIERLDINRNEDLTYTTIDGEKPRGICGSGVIDLVANLVMQNLVERSGRFKDPEDSKRIRRNNGVLEFLIEEGANTETGVDIVFTQSDLRAIQLAKAAIRTGWKILLEETDLTPLDLDDIWLAGAFGNFLDSKNAREIGLVPNIDDKRIFFAGNTALSGAKIALVSLEERKKMDIIADETRYVELGAHPMFNEVFTSSLSF